MCIRDRVWGIYLRAGKTSTLHRTGSDENALKTLLLRPIARYADSLPARLAAWRRWERWASAQQPGSVQTPFKPTDILMGKFLMEVDKGGATAASQAWAGLKWWSDRLGLELALQSPLVADFRLKVPGHTTEQAKVLSLDAIPPLRELAHTTRDTNTTPTRQKWVRSALHQKRTSSFFFSRVHRPLHGLPLSHAELCHDCGRLVP